MSRLNFRQIPHDAYLAQTRILPNNYSMQKIITSFRYLSWIAIICSLLGSLLMFIIGAIKTYYAFYTVFLEKAEIRLSHLNETDAASTYLIKSLDTFLIALVLFIFAFGIFRLFISDRLSDTENTILSWIKIPNISYLKNILAEVIIIILFVKFLEVAIVSLEHLSWEILTLPVSILMLAISLKFLGLRH